MKRAFQVSFVAFGVAALVAVGCGRGDRTPGAPVGTPSIEVGSLLPLSGPDKSFGVTQQRAMNIALEEINAAGGIAGRPLRIEYADTKLNEDLGLQEYKRLTSDKGLFLIQEVTGSGVALRVSPYATQDRVVLLSSLDTSPKLTGVSPYFFRTIASDDYSGVVLSRWAVERGNVGASLVFNSENAWSQGLKGAVETAFPAAGGKWALEPIGVLNSTDDFTSAILAIKAAKPRVQAVVVALMGRQAGLFVSQAKANRLDVAFYGTDTFSQQEFIDNAKGGLEQSFFALPAEPKSQAYELFSAEYRKRYTSEPDSIAAKAYDALHLTAAALRETVKGGGELSGPRVREQLVKMTYEGITGPHAFDANGDLREPRFDCFTYKGGKRSLVQ
jgi:branched-chain amino acid transport system substrate-binding protein